MDTEKPQLVKKLHKPARRNYKRRHVDIRGIDETWQADLVEMLPYKKENKGYTYILTIIDIFPKFAWAVPVKSKTGEDVTSAMKSVLAQGRVPKNLQVDRGKEFYNQSFANLMKHYNINLYSTFSNLKVSICERFNRTLKYKMWVQFSLQGNYKWLNILPDLISSYNDSKHRTIKMKPKDVSKQNVTKTLFNAYKKFKVKTLRRNKQKFEIGDKVKIRKFKHGFEKGYTPNWTTEVFTVSQIQNTEPTTYLLKDYQNKPISGSFHGQELAKVKSPDIYLIEKVLKKRGNELYVKWSGFDKCHNSWINKNNVRFCIFFSENKSPFEKYIKHLVFLSILIRDTNFNKSFLFYFPSTYTLYTSSHICLRWKVTISRNKVSIFTFFPHFFLTIFSTLYKHFFFTKFSKFFTH